MGPQEVTASTRTIPKRQCWECQRRRLVCDFSFPACNKCCAAGVDCPGYGENKPLRWLAPGKVTSWTRQRRRLIAQKDKGQSATAATSSEGITDEIPVLPRHPEREVGKVSVPPSIKLTTEACAAVEAIIYYNSRIFPEFAPMLELGPIPYITPISPYILPVLSPSIHHTLVYLALSHRTHQLPKINSPALTETRSRLYHYRGLAIRSLSEEVSREQTSTSNATIISVLEFLFAEMRQSTSSLWRHHFIGATRLIMLRGGLEELLRTAPFLKGSLIYFVILAVIGNTTTPPSDQIPLASNLDLIDVISDMYGDGLFPSLLCPPSLFLDIIRINHLRVQGAGSSSVNDSAQSTAFAILKRIDAFSPEQWAATSTSTLEEWVLLALIHQSTIALYCISSLQSVSILPSTRQLKATRITHGNRLFPLLKKAMASRRIKKCLAWPLVVAGMEAVNCGPSERQFVEEQLSEMGQAIGSPVPLLGIAVLKRFWATGKTGWDDCFDVPYAFVP